MEIYLFLRIAHLLGFAIGIGGASASDALFFRSLKDKKITADELNLLKTLSKLMWVGVGLLVISGAGFLIYSQITTGSIPLLSNPRFLAKLTIVSVIILNGLIFHLSVIPFLTKSVGQTLSKEFLGNKFILLVSTGGISIASWYSTFIFAMLRQVSLPYLVWMNIYLLAVFCAIAGGYFVFSVKLKLSEQTDSLVNESVKAKKFLKKMVLGLFLAIILITGAVTTKSFVNSAQTHYVCIDEIPPWLHPEVLEIKKGDTVVWKHCEDEHNRHSNTTRLPILMREAKAHDPKHNSETKIIHTHPILAISGPEIFSSGFRPIGHLEEGEQFSFKFTKNGIYEYLCPTHPYMKGVIAVGEKSPVSKLWPPEEKLDPKLMVLPEVPGIGEIWVDTQFEIVPGQRHPGTITVVNAENWEISHTIKDRDFNNPHNLWNTPPLRQSSSEASDRQYIFQTQWHHDIASKIDLKTKEVLKNISIGNAPAHVFVHPVQKERVYWTINNETQVVITDYDLNVIGEIPTAFGPHGIWIDPSGKWMSVAATLAEKLNIIDLEKEEVIATFDAPGLPLATQITNDGKYATISLLLEGKVRFVDLEKMEIVKDVSVGKMPIWAMPDPTGKYLFVPNTGSADISIISLETLEVIKTIPAAAGAHGIAFGYKQGGGYYGYFSNKFARAVGVVDLDTLETIGFIPLGENQWGGNGILTIPNPYDSIDL